MPVGPIGGFVTPDIRLVQNTQWPAYSVTIDWSLLGDGTLDDSEALATAVVMALGTNRLATVDDILPDPDSSDRQGWWGDMDAAEIWSGAWPVGSRLWLMRRSKIAPPQAQTGATIMLIRNFIYEALQPFVDNQIATTFNAIVEQTDRQTIKARIVMYRGNKAAVQLQYQVLWDGIIP